MCGRVRCQNSISGIGRGRAARSLYRQKGTAVGIENAIRFFLDLDVAALTAFAGSALTLGESELGVDWELGPSDRFYRYAFNVEVQPDPVTGESQNRSPHAGRRSADVRCRVTKVNRGGGRDGYRIDVHNVSSERLWVFQGVHTHEAGLA